VTLYVVNSALYQATSNGLYFGPAGYLVTLTSATFSVNSTNAGVAYVMSLQSSGGNFQNYGTLIVNMPSNSYFKTNCAFYNYGTVLIQGSSSFIMTVGATHTGFFDTTAGVISFQSGVHTMTSTSSLIGSNLVTNGTATLIVQTSTFPSFWRLQGSATLDFNTVYSSNETNLIVEGGTLKFSGPGTYVFYSLILQGSSDVLISNAFATVNISHIFQVIGTNNVLQGGSSIVGTFNLMQSCSSVWTAGGSAQYIMYISVNNYGTIDYRPINNGFILRWNGWFR
jgi:hypothetical protein